MTRAAFDRRSFLLGAGATALALPAYHLLRQEPEARADTSAPVLTCPAPGVSELVGRSGLPWNSLVFGHGDDPARFEGWRNRPVDGVLYFPARGSWEEMAQLPERRGNDLMVYSIPPFAPGGSNVAVASGEADQQIGELARKMLRAGWNTPRTVIRLGWESNGDWYEWSWNREGGTQAYVEAFRRFVTVSRRAGLTDVRWDWCLNKGPARYSAGFSWTKGYPGDAYVDVIGIDCYDMWKPTYTEAGWAANLRLNPGLDEVAAFARSRGKKMAVDEWGVIPWNGGGADNPVYLSKMLRWLRMNASIVAWESTYDHSQSMLSTGQHPKAAAQYRKPFPAGWSR